MRDCDIGIDRERGGWAACLYGNHPPANGPKFLFWAKSLLTVRMYAHEETRRTGGSIFIEGRPEGEYMPDPYGDRGQVC
jgi:hypothetical protein